MAGAMGGFLAGSIVAKMLLDKSGWNSSVSSVKGDVKDLQGHTGTLSGIVNSMATAWTLGGAAIVGTITSIVMKTADYGEMLDELRQKTGISTDVLSSFTLAVNKTDLGMGGFATSMKFLSNNLYDASIKGGEAEEKFKRLGVAFENADGSIRPLDQVILDVADKFAGMKDGAEKSATAVDLFGRAGTGMIHMLNLGRDGLQAEMDKAKEFGLVMTNEAAVAGDKFRETLVDLKGSVQGLTMELGNALIPILTDVAEGATDLVSGFRKWLEQNPWVIESITLTVEQVFKLVGNLGDLIGKVIELTNWLPSLINALSGLDIKLSDVSGAGLKFTNMILEAIKDTDNWKNGLAPTADEFGKVDRAMHGVVDTGKSFFTIISDAIAPLTLTNEQLAGYAGTIYTLTGHMGPFINNTQTAGEKLSDMGEIAKALGFKLRDDVKKELEAAEQAMTELRGSTEKTPGAIEALNKKIKELKEYLYGAKIELKETIPYLNGIASASVGAVGGINALLPPLDNERLALLSLAMCYKPVIDGVGDIPPATEKALTAADLAWANFKQNVGSKIGDIVLECLKIPKGLDDALDDLPPLFKGIFKTLYESFATFVADLIAKWVTDFLTDTLLNKTAETAGDVGKTFADMGKAVGSTITGVATSAIDTISGVVTAAASVVMALTMLFKKEDYSSITFWLKPISEATRQTADWLRISFMEYVGFWNSLFISDNFCLYELHGRLVETRDAVSYWGQAICDSIGKIKGAQHGYISTTHELIAVHGTPSIPEITLPEPIYERNLQMAAAMGGGQPGRPFELYINDEPVEFPFKENMRKLLIEQVPYMTKNEQLKIHRRSIRTF